MAMQLRSHRRPGTRSHHTEMPAVGSASQIHPADDVVPPADDQTLAQLVAAAAGVAPAVPAVCIPGVSVSFGELADRAKGAAFAMSGDKRIDDSALTVALMMTVPGLAASGAAGLASTLSSVRIQATMAVAGFRQV